MKDPVEGVFKVADWYDPHPASSAARPRLTGVIIAPGIPPTPAEHVADFQGRWTNHRELPVIVDRADPARFTIEWDRVQRTDRRGAAEDRAEALARQMGATTPEGDPGVTGTTSPAGPSQGT